MIPVDAAQWFYLRQRMLEEDLRIGPPRDWDRRGAAFAIPVVWRAEPYVYGHVMSRERTRCVVHVRGLVDDVYLVVPVDPPSGSTSEIVRGSRVRIVFQKKGNKEEVHRVVTELASRPTLDYGIAKNIAVRSHIGGLLRKWSRVSNPPYSQEGPAIVFARMRHIRDNDADTPDTYFDCTDLVAAAQADPDPDGFLRRLLSVLVSTLGTEPEPPPKDHRDLTLKERAGELFWWATLVSEQSEASSVYQKAYGAAGDVARSTVSLMVSALTDVLCDALHRIHIEDYEGAADRLLALLCFHHNRLQDRLDNLTTEGP